MPHATCRLPLRQLTPTLIAALTTLAAANARADEPNPYYIGASQGLTHDNNVYRSSAPIADTYSTTSLLGGFDQSFSRQHVYGTANVGYNKYRDQTTLDNTSYGVNAGWDWQTINELSGSVNVNASQSLATQNGNQAVVDANGNPLAPSTARDLIKTEQFNTSLRWGGSGPLSLVGAYSHSKVDYSQTLSSESTGDSASINANYRVGPTVTAGIGLRYTRSRSPYGVALVPNPSGPDDYAATSTNGRNIDLTLGWRATAQTGVNARLSYTRQSSSNSGNQDFSGLTGSIGADYAATAKLAFNANYSRDAGTNGYFFNVPSTTTNPTTGTTTTSSTPLLSQNSSVSDTLGVGAAYELSSKIGTTASYQYRRSRNGGGFGGNDYTDKLSTAALGANYAIARNWNLGCNFAHESRDVSSASGIAYSDNTVGCTVQLTLR